MGTVFWHFSITVTECRMCPALMSYDKPLHLHKGATTSRSMSKWISRKEQSPSTSNGISVKAIWYLQKNEPPNLRPMSHHFSIQWASIFSTISQYCTSPTNGNEHSSFHKSSNVPAHTRPMSQTLSVQWATTFMNNEHWALRLSIKMSQHSDQWAMSMHHCIYVNI